MASTEGPSASNAASDSASASADASSSSQPTSVPKIRIGASSAQLGLSSKNGCHSSKLRSTASIKPTHQSSPIHSVSPSTSLVYRSGSKPAAFSPNMRQMSLNRRINMPIMRSACAEDSKTGSFSPPQMSGSHTLGGTRSGPIAKALRKPSSVTMSMHSSGVASDIRKTSSSRISSCESGVSGITSIASARTPVLRIVPPPTLRYELRIPGPERLQGHESAVLIIHPQCCGPTAHVLLDSPVLTNRNLFGAFDERSGQSNQDETVEHCSRLERDFAT